MHKAPARVARRPVHGVLLLDKPLGLSSNDALQKVRRLLNAEKAGHTGTLDPLATGLLPCCLGGATKFSQVHLEADKGYDAKLKLGVTTTTGDKEGEVLETREVRVTQQGIQNVLAQFTGVLQQTPHRYSAIASNGRRAYEYAREGISIELESREICIQALELLSFEDDELCICVRCSKGTYIRVLAEDIGKVLGCGAHLNALRRTHTGGLELKQAVSLSALEAMSMTEREAQIQPLDLLLKDFASVTLNNSEAGRFLTGLRRRVTLNDTGLIKVYGEEPHVLLGTAHILSGELIPTRLLSPQEITQIIEQDSRHQLEMTS